MVRYPVPWSRLGAVDFGALAEARLQAHWAAQLLSAAADAVAERAADDSHTNLFWDGAVDALVGRDLGGIRLALRPSDLAILWSADGASPPAIELQGTTLDKARALLEERLSKAFSRDISIAFRDYDMPAHPIQRGAPFPAPDAPAMEELTSWFAGGAAALETAAARQPGSTEVATWPHHFDVGAIAFLDPDAPPEKAPQIGFGMSPGDHHIEQPYFYVTAWPISDSAAMTLPAGRWTRAGFTGAVLEAAEIVGWDPPERADRVMDFLNAALEGGRRMVATSAGS